MTTPDFRLGQPEKEISSALITLDVTENVIDEAIQKGCDIVISHHPLIFNGIKKITGKSAADRILVKAIKNEYCCLFLTYQSGYDE